MKVAVIGRGFGANAMAPAFEGLGWQVEVVSSRDRAEVERACAAADLVSIHSPPFQHREHVLAALAAGRDVLCDKPFGRNGAEAREMRDAAKAAGVLHFLNFEFRRQPAWRRAKELVDQGAIGRLSHVSWTSFGSGMRGRPHGWLYDADLGGGWIGAYGSHVIDALRFFFGAEVADCGGVVRTETKSRPGADGAAVASTAEDSFSCWFRMEGGGTASIDTSYAAPVNLPNVTYLVGEDAAIAITSDRTLQVHRRKQAPEEIDVSAEAAGSGFPAVPLWLEQVTQAWKERRQIAPNFDDGVAAGEAMDKLRAAVARA